MAGDVENAKVIMQAVDNFSKVLKAYYGAMDDVERTTKEAGRAMQQLDPGPALAKVSAAGKTIADSQEKVGKSARAASGVYKDAQDKMRDASGRFVKGAKADLDKNAADTGRWATIVKGIYLSIGHAIVEMGLKAGRAMVDFAGDAIKLASDFESGMKKISSAAGGSLAEAGLTMDDVKAKALELGQVTQFSAADAQEAFLNLVKGGVPIKTAFGEATQATLDLAAAADVELGPAAEYIAKQFAAWSKTGVTATDIADTMSQTAQASAVNVDDLALGLYNVGGAASGMGMSFEDANRGIALVVSGFSGGAEAGTGFKSMLAALTPTSKTAKNAMRELGLITKDGASVFFDAQGSYKGLENTAGELQKAFAGLSQEQKAVYAEAIFGTYGMNAAIKLMEAGSSGVRDMTSSMDALGSAQVQAKARQEGFAYVMDQFNGTIETLKITLGTPLIQVLAAVMEVGVIPLANAILGLARGFTISDGAIAKIKTTIANVGSVFMNLFKIIGGDTAISRIHGLQFALETFMPKSMAKQVSMFVANLVNGLQVAINWVVANWPKVQAAIGSVLSFLVYMAQNYGIPFVTLLTGVLAGAIGWVVANWPMISTYISATLATIGFLAETYVLPFVTTAIGYFNQAVTWVQTEWPKVEGLIGAGLAAVIGFVAIYVAPFVTGLISKIGEAITWVQTTWPQVQTGIGDGLTGVLGFVTTYVVPFVTQLIAKISEAVQWVIANWPQISTMIGNALTGIVGFIAIYVVPFVTQLIAKISEAVQWVIANWPQISTMIGNALTNIVGFVTTYVAPFVAGLIGALMGAVSWVIENWPKISSTVSTVLNGIGVVLGIFMPVIDALTYAFGKVVSFVLANFPLMVQVASKFQAGFAIAFKIVEPLLLVIGAAFKVAFALIGQTIKNFVDIGLTLFKAGMQLFVGDINGALATLTGYFAEKFLAIRNFLTTQVGEFLKLGGNVMQGLLDGLKAKGSQLYDYLVGVVKNAVGGVMNFLGIHSPSRLMEFYGEMTMRGFADGMLNMTEQVADAARIVVENAVAEVGSAMGDMAAMATEGGTGGVLGALAALGVEGGGDGQGAVGGGSSQTVNVNVDGRRVAQAVVNNGAAPVRRNRRRTYGGGGSSTRYK